MNSNAAQVIAELHKWVDGYDLTNPRAPVGKKLAADVLDAFGAGIYERSINEQAEPSGEPWPDNARKYKESKKKANKPIGVLTGDMLSRVEMYGERKVEPHEATLKYGVTPFCRDKAQWFTCGSAPHDGLDPSGAKDQPPRPFFALDDKIREECDRLIENAHERHVNDWNGGIH